LERPSSQDAVRLLSSVCPLPWAAARLQSRLEPMLSSASLYVSPRVYSRFVVALLFLTAPVEALSVLLPREQALLIVGSVAALQAMPVLVLVSNAQSRSRGCEGELPFFLMTLSVFSHESNPSLQDGLARISAIGPSVFPAFSHEADILARDQAYVPGSPVGIAERAFGNHPSARVRSFVRGFLKTTETGKDVIEFVGEETRTEIERLERSWSSFASSVGSVSEVAFILLALFPVGLEMLGATVSGFTTSLVFVGAFGALSGTAVAFLFLADSVQPLTRDSPPRSLALYACLGGWALATFAYYLGRLSALEYVLVPLLVSVAGVYLTLQHHSMIRQGEREVSSLLHDLAEESKAGVSLVEALSKLSDVSGQFRSVREALLTFYRATQLGSTPTEAQRMVSHPSWLVRLGFGILSVAFETGAGFEHLEDLSALFHRVVDARRGVTQSMIPFLLIGAIVPVISISAITFISGLAQAGPIGLPGVGIQMNERSLILSVSMISLLSGLLLSKLLTQSVRHLVALPIVMASTLVALLAFGVA
jgi:hypothetical protein